MENILSMFNIKKLSNETGIPISNLYRYRSDPSTMKVRDLRRIALVTGMSERSIAELVLKAH